MPTQKNLDHNQPLNLCGKRLHQIRKSKNLSLIEIQATLDVDYGIALDRTNLGRIENGKRIVNDIELVILAHLLDVSIENLLWGETTPKTDELGDILKKVRVRHGTGNFRQSKDS